jgi:hypothetical protein
MTTTVLIWDNNQVGGGHKTVGHAAINIDDYWGPDIAVEEPAPRPAAAVAGAIPVKTAAGFKPPPLARTGAADKVEAPDKPGEYPKSYVSWWPANVQAGKRLGSAWPSFQRDLVKERYAPDHILRLTGLNEEDMRAEWARIRGKENAHYRLYVKNCSTIVARILRAGTSWTNRNPWRAHSELWTPLKAKRFALSLGAKQVEWADFCAEVRKRSYFYEIREGNPTVRRSDEHGNPNTPARFVKGKDTWKTDATPAVKTVPPRRH